MRPLSVFSLLSVGLLAAGLLAARQTSRGALVATAGIVVVLSTAPLSATYPLIHLMASFFASILFAVLMFIGLFCARIVELFRPPLEE